MTWLKFQTSSSSVRVSVKMFVLSVSRVVRRSQLHLSWAKNYCQETRQEEVGRLQSRETRSKQEESCRMIWFKRPKPRQRSGQQQWAFQLLETKECEEHQAKVPCDVHKLRSHQLQQRTDQSAARLSHWVYDWVQCSHDWQDQENCQVPQHGR